MWKIRSAARTGEHAPRVRKTMGVRLARLESLHGSRRSFTLAEARAIIDADIAASREPEPDPEDRPRTSAPAPVPVPVPVATRLPAIVIAAGKAIIDNREGIERSLRGIAAACRPGVERAIAEARKVVNAESARKVVDAVAAAASWAVERLARFLRPAAR